MKKILATGICVFMSSGFVYANEMSVEITSFVRAGLRTRTAELCGKVKNMDQPWVIARVKVDANDKNPGFYNTLVGSEGKFCISVVSNGGDAEVSLASLEGKALTPKQEVKLVINGRE